MSSPTLTAGMQGSTVVIAGDGRNESRELDRSWRCGDVEP
jgi:hypothetical protein